jgi:hypothetical protein
MIKILNRPFIRRRRPPATLTLVAAAYQNGDYVRLTFDREISNYALDATELFVDDKTLSGKRWRGTGTGTLLGPHIVQIGLSEVGPTSVPSGILLTASPYTGIVAAGDVEITWAGADALPLQYP